jgi:hypothetical protein
VIGNAAVEYGASKAAVINTLLVADFYSDSSGTRKNPLRSSFVAILVRFMIRAGFLDPESRQDLIDLARDGSAAHRLGRRANAILLLDDGMTCEATARVLFVDDDTVPRLLNATESPGLEGGYRCPPERRGSGPGLACWSCLT